MNAKTYIERLAQTYSKVEEKLETRAGAKATAIRALEKKCDVRFPKELVAMWRARNGSKQVLFAQPGQLTGFTFLSITEAWRSREMFRSTAPQYEGYRESPPRSPRIKPGWFQEGWLPFADFGGMTMVLMLDCSPASRGSKGQVIAYVHDPDRIEWVAPSFETFLSRSLKMIQSDPQEVLGFF